MTAQSKNMPPSIFQDEVKKTDKTTSNFSLNNGERARKNILKANTPNVQKEIICPFSAPNFIRTGRE